MDPNANAPDRSKPVRRIVRFYFTLAKDYFETFSTGNWISVTVLGSF